MGPPSTSGDALIKKEIHDPQDVIKNHNVPITRSVEIFVDEDYSFVERDLVLKNILRNVNGKDPPLLDPTISNTLGSTEEERLLLDDEIKIENENPYEGALDDITMKEEDEWEEKEIDIIDNQLDNLSNSPRKRAAELKRLLAQNCENTEIENPYFLRKRSQKKSMIQIEATTSKQFSEEVNIWSDDSDEDPDFSPIDDMDAVTKKSVKRCAAKKNVVKKIRNKIKKRIYKKHACLYCNKKFGKIVRHLTLLHKNEPDVRNWVILPIGSLERRLGIKAITKKGNLNYNEELDKQVQEQKQQTVKLRNKNAPKICRKINVKKRIYKKNVCLYCKKRYIKLAKHFELMHSNEPEVQKFLKFSKRSKERLQVINLIRNKGNFTYNVNVITNNSGSIITKRTNKSQNRYENFVPCPRCFGFYKRSLSNRHEQICSQNKINEILVKDVDSGIPDMNGELTPMDVINSLLQGKTNVELKLNSGELRIPKKPSKRTSCYYCNKFPTKLLPHLKAKHPCQPEVKHILSLEKGSKERFFALQTLRRRANFVHNNKVIMDNCGKLIASRTPDTEDKFKNLLPCEYCFGFFNKRSLMRHINKCPWNKTSEKEKQMDKLRFSDCKRLSDMNSYCSSLLVNSSSGLEFSFEEILKQNKNNKVLTLAKTDDLIVKYGLLLMNKKKISNRLLAYKMGLLAKLVLHMNACDEIIVSLIDCLKPNQFNNILIESLKICASKDKNNSISKENALRISIKHCCMIVKSDCIMQKNDKELIEINDFLLLIRKYWFKSVLAKIYQASIESKNNVNEEGGLLKKKSEIEISELQKTIDFKEIFSTGHSGKVVDLNQHQNLFYTKFCICLYCKKPYTKIVRHWNTCHKNEPDIKHLALLDKYSSERKLLIKSLRNKGNFFHNKKVLRNKKGVLIPVKGRVVKSNFDKYLPCEHCLGFYKGGKTLQIHFRRCPSNPILIRESDSTVKYSLSATFLSSLVLFDHNDKANNDVAEIISLLKNDNVKSVICKDDLIMKLGSVLINTNIKKKSNSVKRNPYKLVSMKLRDTANLVITSQQYQNEIKSLGHCLQPKYFHIVLRAARELCFSKSDMKAAKAHFLRLRLIIQIVCRIKKNENLLVKNNENDYKSAVQFLKLLCKDWVLSEEAPFTLNHENEQNETGEMRLKSSETIYGTFTGKRNRKLWDIDELNLISTFFKNHLKDSRLPGKSEIQKFIQQHKCLTDRGWISIKSKLFIMMKDKRKNISDDRKEDKSGSSIEKFKNDFKSLPFKKRNIEINSATLIEKNNVVTNEDKMEDLSSDQNNLSLSKQLLSSPEHLVSKKHKSEKDKQFSSLQSTVVTNDSIILSERVNNSIDNCCEEERTYFLLGSCDFPQGNSKSNHCTENSIENNISVSHEPSNCQSDKTVTNIRGELIEQNILLENLPCINQLHKQAPINTGEPTESNTFLVNMSFTSESDTHATNNTGDKIKPNILVQNVPVIRQSDANIEEPIESNILLATLVANSRLNKKAKNKTENPIEGDILFSVEQAHSKSNNTYTEVEMNDVHLEHDVTGRENKTPTKRESTSTIYFDSSCNKKFERKGFNRGWTNEETEAVLSFFKENIKKRKIPSKFECEDCINEIECLASRDWVSIKSKIHNIITLANKNKKKRFDNQFYFLKNNREKQGSGETCKENNVEVTNVCGKEMNEKSSSSQFNNCQKSRVPASEINVIQNKKRKQEIVKHPWSLEENEVIENFFKENIIQETVPGKKDCEKCINLNNCLASRSWVTVKSKVHNIIVSKKRKTNF